MITRDAAHRYTYEGVQYPGVTSILGVMDKSAALMNWAARQTAEAAVGLVQNLPAMIATTGEEGTIKALTSRSSWKRDEAAQLGTDVHHIADLVVRGQPTPPMTDTQRARVLHYAKWWEAMLKAGTKLRLSEAMVVRPDGQENGIPAVNGWGGTFDLLYYDGDGQTVLADIKTGKAVYREAVLQLAAYGMASLVQPATENVMEGGRVYPMPVPDRYQVIHVTGEGVREVEFNVGTPERMAFLACLDLYHWMDSMKGKRL
jgi:hypothetical protein